MPNFQPLVQTYRNNTLECVHYGAVAVADTTGRLLAQVGDPYWLSFTRSTLKALQAIPFVEKGGVQRFSFTNKQVAMLCASHNGEAMHVEQVDGMLANAGLTQRALRCGCHVPGIFSYFEKSAPEGTTYDERYNNCSGKHAGFLAYCVQHGLDLETYFQMEHPLQQAIQQAVSRATRTPIDAMAIGIDGCSAPNFAVPLMNLAVGYARLASGIRDSEYGDSFAILSQAMTDHPEMVSGTGRNDLAFMRIGRGDWVSKIGADGVQVIGSKSREQALAIKISDANRFAQCAATVAVLDQLGWLDEEQKTQLHEWKFSEIRNANGWQVGHRQAVLQLQKV